MSQFLFQKGTTGLVPACDEASEWLSKKRLGAIIRVEPHEMRNGAFFKKWFALIEMAYSYWSETVKPIEYRGQAVLPSFTRFRKDMTILCGYYDAVTNIKGEVRIEAASIAWASMDEDTFTKLYDATIQVLLSKVFNGRVCKQWTESELRSVTEQIMSFAA